MIAKTSTIDNIPRSTPGSRRLSHYQYTVAYTNQNHATPLSAVVDKMSGFLQEGPTAFYASNNYLYSCTTSTSNERLTIDESIVLIDGKHLGLDARSLPWVTWEIRYDCRQCRKQRGDGNDTTIELLLWLTVTSC